MSEKEQQKGWAVFAPITALKNLITGGTPPEQEIVGEATTEAAPAAKSEEPSPVLKAVEKEFTFLSKSVEKRIVSGVLIAPQTDLQGDYTSPEEIEKAAYGYMVEYRKSAGNAVQHAPEFNEQLYVVESYIAPCDLTIGTQAVAKGSWVVSLYVADDAVWESIKKGELTGFSYSGTAVGIPVAQAA